MGVQLRLCSSVGKVVRGVGISWSWSYTDSCERPDLCAGNRTRILSSPHLSFYVHTLMAGYFLTSDRVGRSAEPPRVARRNPPGDPSRPEGSRRAGPPRPARVAASGTCWISSSMSDCWRPSSFIGKPVCGSSTVSRYRPLFALLGELSAPATERTTSLLVTPRHPRRLGKRAGPHKLPAAPSAAAPDPRGRSPQSMVDDPGGPLRTRPAAAARDLNAGTPRRAGRR